MADPVSVMMLVNASFGITRSLVHTIKDLYELAEAYETAALGIRTVATQCNSFRIAVQRISKWLETQDEDTRQNLDEDFWQALAQNLDTAKMVMDDLDKRIVNLKKTPSKLWTRTKYLWNSVVISELQTQIGSLMNAVSILLQVIDIPTPGGKRSYSLAHKNKLNRLTKSVRHNVDEERARIRARQEQNMLNNAVSNNNLPDLESSQTKPEAAAVARVNSESLLPETQHQPSISDLAIPDTAPPPYDFVQDGKTGASEDGWYLDKKGRKKSSGDEKMKRGFWKASRASKTNSSSGFASLFASSKSPSLEKQSASPKPSASFGEPSDTTNPGKDSTHTASSTSQPIVSSPEFSTSHLSQTPAPIDATTEKEYFELQLAMSGMGMMSSDFSAIEKDPFKPVFPVTPAPAEPASNTLESLITFELEEQTQSSTDASMPTRPIATQSAPTTVPTLRSRSTYHDNIVESSKKFERIRPSQRVKESRERSPAPSSRQNTNSPLESNSSLDLSRQSTNTRLNSGSNTQNWITYPMPSQRVRFRVEFADDTFTNRMSASAARTLGVEDYITEYAGIPITNLTMLNTVEDDCVVGDEVEFVVMDEHEQRTPLLVLGAGLAHMKRLMQEGEYIYWDSQPVPEKLRTADKLRLFRRFEMVRW